MWLDWLIFCNYGFGVSALWCPLATPTILLWFLLRWMWGISSRLLQQSADSAPYLGRGISPHDCPYWPWTWSSSSRPPMPAQPPLLEHGILGPLIKANWKWSNRKWQENIDIIGTREPKWTRMGEFNSDDYYIYYCGQESLRRNGVAIMVNKRVQNAVLGCNLKNNRSDLCSFPRQTIQYHSDPSLCPNQ